MNKVTSLLQENTHLLQTTLITYWIAAISSILLKPFIKPIDKALTYGKIVDHQQTYYQTSYSKLVSNLSASPSVVWPSFYYTALIFWILCILVSESFPNYLSYLILIQIARRLYECLFVHRFSTSRRTPIIQIVAGCSFYIMMPITALLEPSLRSLDNVYSYWWHIKYVMITTVFLFASLIQNHAHRTLANVKPLVGKYGIPDGVLFRVVCYPHYLAEVMIYLLFALLVNSLNTWLMFVFVIINLTDSALRTATWYKTKFAPNLLIHRPRWTIIPFLV